MTTPDDNGPSELDIDPVANNGYCPVLTTQREESGRKVQKFMTQHTPGAAAPTPSAPADVLQQALDALENMPGPHAFVQPPEHTAAVTAIASLRAALAAPVVPPRLSDERIEQIWDSFVGDPSETHPLILADKINFARAVLAAAQAAPPAQEPGAHHE
jgi:hypothetical protein